MTAQQEWLEIALNICWESGSTGNEIDQPRPGWFRIYFPDSTTMQSAQSRLIGSIPIRDACLDIQAGTIEDPGWRTAWHRFFKPVEAGNSFLILPSWEPVPQTQRRIIRIHPGQAFGTGHHETTVLCLQHLETIDVNGKKSLDAGCGSGILGIAAALLGASHVTGIDIEPEATRESAQNAEMNHVGSVCGWIHGDLKTVADVYDICLGNLQTGWLMDNHRLILDHTAPGGFLILSGFLVPDIVSIVNRFESTGLIHSCSVKESGEWAAILMRKAG